MVTSVARNNLYPFTSWGRIYSSSKERCIFGERAASDQIIGVVLMLTSIAGRYYFTSFWLDCFAIILILVGLFIYLIPGHALIYGPHLFLVAIWESFAGRSKPDDER